jgi:hypothetical protein
MKAFRFSRATLAIAALSASTAAILAACGGSGSTPAASSSRATAQSAAPADPDHFTTTSADQMPLSCAPQQTISAGGWSSCNVQWLGRYPIPGLTIGARVVGNRLYVSNWTSGWHVFDVSDPENPTLLGKVFIDGGSTSTLAAAVENEDPATNGSIAVLSRTPYNDALVLDTRNPANITGKSVPGASAHTHTCLYNCQWSYGSTTGVILDLRDPDNPVLLPNKWTDAPGAPAKAHDLTEVKPGMVVTASDPATVLDTTDPANPKVMFTLPRVATGSIPLGPAQAGRIGHNVIWPRAGDDRWFMGLSEGAYDGRCETYPDEGRTIYNFDTTGWQSAKTFTQVAQYTLVSGNGDTGLAGGPAMIDSNGNPSTIEYSVEGCSVHWFDPNPRFANGGLVAMASFNHGMRLLNVAGDGRIEQVGYFVTNGTTGFAATVDVRWGSDRVAYVFDFAGGSMDVVKYTGPLPNKGPLKSY